MRFKDKNDLNKKRSIYFLVFFVTGVMLVYKCRYGFAQWDESFYLTIPYRLYLGDGLLIHEWHVTQMAGVLLYPFVAVYMKIIKTTDWIVLAFRYLYVLLHMGTSLFVYYKLRGKNEIAGSLISLIYLLYAPFGIMALSYNSMGLGALTIMLVILEDASHRGEFFISGVFFAVSVLCCPYLAVLFIYFLLWTCLKQEGCMSTKFFFYWTAGIAVSTLLFFGFVFGRMTLQELWEVLPHILNDPEHYHRTLGELISTYFTSLFKGTIMTGTYFAEGVLIVIVLLDRKRSGRKALYLNLVSILVLLQLYHFVFRRPYINCLMLPLNLYFPFILLLSGDESRARYMCWIRRYTVPGVIYTFCIHCASNQKLYNISSASFVVLIGTILMLMDYLNTMRIEKGKNRITIIVCSAVCLCMLSALGIQRYKSIYWEPSSMKGQTVLITDGPQKGIYVHPDRYTVYYTDYNDVMSYIGTGKVLYWCPSRWMYLMTENEFATPSAWMSGDYSFQLEQLKEYYRINPEKFPQQILCEASNQEYADKLLSAYDCSYSAILTENNYVVYSIRASEA